MGISWGNIDWEGVREAYENGVQEFATQEFPGTPYWETNSQYYGSPRWIDVLAEGNLNNDLEHHHGHNHYGDHDSDSLEARVRLFERTVLDQVSTHLMMGLLQAAAKGDQGAWDAAAAVYTGCGNDNTSPENTLYGRSDSVGTHFGTLSDDDTSLTNYEVLEAFQDGLENVAIVERAVQRTSWQSLLRYAHLLDGHLKNDSDWLEHQAEGWGAWRVLEGLVALDDAERAAMITALFSMQSDAPVPLLPNNYCYLSTVLEEDLGLANEKAFGNFADAMDVDCDSVEPLEFPGGDDHDDHGHHDDHDDHDGHDDHDDHDD